MAWRDVKDWRGVSHPTLDPSTSLRMSGPAPGQGTPSPKPQIPRRASEWDWGESGDGGPKAWFRRAKIAGMSMGLDSNGRRLSERVGEVVESDSTAFEAQCYRLQEPPALGSLVVADDGAMEVLGVVSGAGTSSIQPGRRALARGEDEESVESLYANNPQIEKLLMTTFRAEIVGYREAGRIVQRLPARPPRVHSFVCGCSLEEQASFGGSFEFLSILVGGRGQVGDQLIGACLRQLSEAADDPREFLVGAGKALTVIWASEPQRLYTLLSGIRP